MSTSPIGHGNSPLALRDRIERVHQDLVAQRQSADRATALVAILGIIIIVGAGAFFFYGYSKINELVNQPKTLVAFAAGSLEDQLPQFRAQVEGEVNNKAPEWAQALSDHLRRSLPDLRQRFVSYAIGQADHAFNDATALTDEQMHNVITKNKGRVREVLRQLQTQDELPDASMHVLEQAMEEELQTDMTAQSRQIMDALLAAREKMARLKSGKKLLPGEDLERNILLIARRMRADYEEPKNAGKPLNTDQSLFKPAMTLQPATPNSVPEATKPPADTSKKPEDKKPEDKKPEDKKPGDKKPGDKKP